MIFKIVKEIGQLSDLRRHQQLMSFYMLFVAALLLAFTDKLYIELFGAEGLIYKDYFISLFGLVALIKILQISQLKIQWQHLDLLLSWNLLHWKS